MKKIGIILLTLLFLSTFFSSTSYAEKSPSDSSPPYLSPWSLWPLGDWAYLITEEFSKTTQPLTGKIIVLDAGHGGKDNGASVEGLKEKEVNLSVALKAASLLKEKGAEVHVTREGDTTLSREDRYLLAGKTGAAIFISIHANSGDQDVSGLETFYHYKRDEKLAKSLHRQLIDETYTHDRGTKFGDYYVLRENSVPSALIEMGFLTNDKDFMNLSSDTFHELIAKGIVNGVLDYFN